MHRYVILKTMRKRVGHSLSHMMVVYCIGNTVYFSCLHFHSSFQGRISLEIISSISCFSEQHCCPMLLDCKAMVSEIALLTPYLPICSFLYF